MPQNQLNGYDDRRFRFPITYLHYLCHVNNTGIQMQYMETNQKVK